MEADGLADTNTRERSDGATEAVQAKHGDSCTAQRLQDGPKISTCFGVMAEPPFLPCTDGVVVENSVAAPKSCLSPLEMRSPTAAGGLLPTDKVSIVTRTTYNQPPIRLYSTGETNSKKTNLRTPILFVSYDSSFRRNKLLAVPSCRRVIETKYGQNRMFDQAVLKVIPAPARFGKRGARYFVIRLCVSKRLVAICSVFGGSMIQDSKTCRRRRRTVYAMCIAVNRFSPIRLV